MADLLQKTALLPILAIMLSVVMMPQATTVVPKTQLLSELLQDIAALRSGEYHFWACHGMDTQHGGFHGTLSRDGTAVTPDAKGLVQQTRHIWGFSTFQEYGYTSSSTVGNLTIPCGASIATADAAAGTPSSEDMARSAYQFVIAHMARPDGMFKWNVSRDGSTVIQNNPVLYGQWFVQYSLSQYYQVFGELEARDHALACFMAADEAWHNSNIGGYNEFKNSTFPPDLVAPSGSSESAVAAEKDDQADLPTSNASKDADKASDIDSNVLPRSLNVLMHGMEALTALHKATDNPTVLARLQELVDILCTRLVRVKGLIFEEYVPGATREELWVPAPGSTINYGHNLESTWLVVETLDYLQSLKAITEQQASKYLATVVSIGQSALRDGYDSAHGGVYESGNPEDGVTSTVKVWWVQAESMLAMWKIYQHTQDLADLQMLAETAQFVRRYILDDTHGGLYWQVAADGTFEPTDNLDKGTKGNRWKASYHSGRSVVYLHDWITAAL